eukprot:g2211.t1
MLRFTGKFVTAAAASCAAFALVPDGVVESEASDRLHILRKQLKPYRKTEQEFRKRWERDEAEGFRKLPARAWPAYQPDPEDIDMLLVKLADSHCMDGKGNVVKPNHSQCKEATFYLATALVFNNLDVSKGLQLFRALADEGDSPDGMCAYAVVHLEGYGVEQNEKLALKYLKLAIEKYNHAQAMYELGSCYYTGLEGVLEENESLAFELFEKAADADHVAAKYMCADMLLEGSGVTVDIARAIPLLYAAAEDGHRFSRQRMRELLDECSE